MYVRTLCTSETRLQTYTYAGATGGNLVSTITLHYSITLQRSSDVLEELLLVTQIYLVSGRDWAMQT